MWEWWWHLFLLNIKHIGVHNVKNKNILLFFCWFILLRCENLSLLIFIKQILLGRAFLWQDVSRDIIAIWCFFGDWRQNMCFYFVLFCMSMKKHLVITIWFGFVGDNMTWRNTMLGFAMDFENGIKGKKNWLYIFLVINALILSNLCCNFCILLFQFQFMKTFVLFFFFWNYYIFFLIKEFVCFNLSCSFCICLWVKS